jgi:hypothetical protein
MKKVIRNKFQNGETLKTTGSSKGDMARNAFLYQTAIPIKKKSTTTKKKTLAELNAERTQATQAKLLNTKSASSSPKVILSKSIDLGAPLKERDLVQEGTDYRRSIESEFLRNTPNILGITGEDISNFYLEDGNTLDYDKIAKVLSDPDYNKKSDKFAQKKFLEWEKKRYDESSLYDKTLNAASSFLKNPILTTQNALLGSDATGYHRPLMGQWQGLSDDTKMGDYYRTALDYDDQWLDQSVNFFNPLNYAGEAVIDTGKGEYPSAVANYLGALTMGRLPTGKGLANLATQITPAAPYIRSGAKGLKNVINRSASPKDLFKRSDLGRFTDKEGLEYMKQSMASGGLDPSDFRWNSSFQTSPDAFKYIKDGKGFIKKIPMTQAEASGFRLKHLSKPKNYKKLSSTDKLAVDEGLTRSIPSLKEVNTNPLLRKIYENRPSGILKKDLDALLKNPEGYWENPLFTNNPAMQKFLSNKKFFSNKEYLLPRGGISDYTPITEVGIQNLLAPVVSKQALKKEISEGVALTAEGHAPGVLAPLSEEEHKNGGPIKFNSLPLYIQDKSSMSGSNKYQIGDFLATGKRGIAPAELVCDENGLYVTRMDVLLQIKCIQIELSLRMML